MPTYIIPTKTVRKLLREGKLEKEVQDGERTGRIILTLQGMDYIYRPARKNPNYYILEDKT